jgi:hypothetical protein
LHPRNKSAIASLHKSCKATTGHPVVGRAGEIEEDGIEEGGIEEVAAEISGAT